MKKLLPVAFLVLSSVYTSAATASDNWYIGALYSAQKTKPMAGRNFDTAGIIVGYQYNEYIGVEARFSGGLSGYSNSWSDTDSSEFEYYEDVDNQSSFLIKTSYPILDSFYVYGLAGYTNTKLEVGGSGQYTDHNVNEDYSFKRSLSENGFSYGLGVNYQLNEQLNIFVDYQVLPDFQTAITFEEQDWDWKSTNIGINYVF